MSAGNHQRHHQHELPHPGAPVDVHRGPFVGNETIDENLVECAQIAVWNALGPIGGHVEFGTANGAIRVGGHVETREDRDAALRAVAMAIPSAHLIDDLTVKATKAAARPPASPAAVGAPIVRVRRFCSLTDSSLSAAIRSALDRLDTTLAPSGARLDRVVVIYRNRGRSTVTIDVGIPMDPLIGADGDVQNDRMPSGPEVSTLAAAGVEGLMAAQALLLGDAHGTEHDAVWWQTFSAAEIRPWTGLPASQLHLALDSIHGTGARGGIVGGLPA